MKAKASCPQACLSLFLLPMKCNRIQGKIQTELLGEAALFGDLLKPKHSLPWL